MPGSNLIGVNKVITQQIDILPSVLDYLNYDRNYSAFGSSIFSKESAHFAINYTNGIYQFISEGFALQFDGTNYVSMYDLKKDSLLEKNLINLDIPKKRNIQDLGKAMIQAYNHSLIYNKMNQN